MKKNTLNFLNAANDLLNNILLFAKNNSTTKEPISSIRSSGENFVYDSAFRYYLSKDIMQEIYTMILKFNTNKHINNIDLTNPFQGEMADFGKDLRRVLKRILRISRNKSAKKGRISNVSPYLTLLHDMLYVNIDSSVNVLLHILRGKVAEFFISDDESDSLKFSSSETTMSLAFGHNMLKAYFAQLTCLNNAKSMDVITNDSFDEIIRIIFNVYHAQLLLETEKTKPDDKILKIPLEHLEKIKYILQKLNHDNNFTILLNDCNALELFCQKLLSNTLHKLLRKKISIGLIDLESYLEQHKISDATIGAMLLRIKETSMEAEYLIGSIIVNHLIEAKIFTVFKVKEDGKTIYYLELCSKLTFALQQNGSDVKPFLCEENKEAFKDITLTTADDIVLNFKRENLLNPLKENNTGYCYFHHDSIFSKHPNIAEIYGCIDKNFLNAFIENLTKYADKKYEDFCDTDKLNALYSLSFMIIMISYFDGDCCLFYVLLFICYSIRTIISLCKWFCLINLYV